MSQPLATSVPSSLQLLKRFARSLGGQRLARAARVWYHSMTSNGIVTLDGVRLPVEPHMSPTMREVLYSGTYEAAESRLLRRRLAADDRVLECGAGIGFVATAAARTCGSENVLAVEANDLLRPLIEKTFALNGVSPRLLIGLVAAETRADAKFHVSRDFWASSAVRAAAGSQLVGCHAVSLSDLIAEFRPTFLILDIEGGEAGLCATVIGSSVRKVMIEMHRHIVGSDGVRRVREWLSSQGFAVVEDCGDESVIYLERPA